MAIQLDQARAAGYSDAEILKGYSESKKFDLEGARAAGYTDKEILDRLAVPPAPAAPAAPPSRSFLSAYAAAPEEIMRGIGAGIIGTGVGAYNLARKIPGVDQVLPAPSPFVQSLTQEPDSFAGKLGKGFEQMAEFAAPLGATSKLLSAAPFAAKLAGSAATAALTTGVQTGGDQKAMGFSGLTVGALDGAFAGVTKGIPAARTALVRRLANSSPRPLSPEAVAMAEKLDIPLSVGDRSGSKFAQGAQKIAGATIAPDLAEAHAAAGAAGIQRGIGDLTGDFATDHFAAGDHAIQGLVQHSKAAQESAGGSYNDLARAEAHPDNIVSVQQGVKKVPVPAGSVLDASGNPSPAGFKEVPIMENIGLPVDTTEAKKLLEPVARTMKNQYPLTRQQSDAGFHAVQNILSGPRYVPASVAENFLSAAKKLQRESTGPVKLLSGQAIDAMSPLVDDAVGRAGQTAVDTLHDGRAAWKEHMGTEDLLQSLAGDTSGKTGQTEAAARLLRPADASYPMLQQVLAKTPEAAESLRGAILSRVFKKAETGEFTNPTQAANIFNQVGKRTQAALFSPEQLGDVKATLELAKRLAENPNPSGTGSLNAMMKMGLLALHPVSGVTTLVLGRNFAKALYNPESAMALRAALTGGKAAPAAIATLEKAIAPAAETAAPAAEAAAPAAATDIRPFEGGGRVGVTDAEAPPEGTLFAPQDTPAAPRLNWNRAPDPPAAPQAPPIAAPVPAVAPTPDPAPAAAPQAAPYPPVPGSIVRMSPHDITADPARFQFKRDTGGKSGTSDELKDIKKYDPELGGLLSVWHDPADGRTYVANGHHRLELAQRTDAPHVDALYLDAKNANEAMTKGALINMAEGRGTAIDAAKVLRDSDISPAELEKRGVSLKGPVARDGANLSRLSPQLFNHVLTGELPMQKASLIGELLPSHADQQSALDLLGRAEKNGKTITNDAFRELVSFVKDGPKKTGAVSENMGLFGDAEPEQESAALEMAGLSDYIRKRLTSEKKLFGTVADVGKSKVLEQAGNSLVGDKNAEMATGAAQHLAVYDKLKTSAGEIYNTLTKAAEGLGKKGAPANEIKDHAYQRIRAAIAKDIGGSKK